MNKEGAVAPPPEGAEDFREGFQNEYGQTVEKVEGIKTELQVKELREFAEQVDRDIAYLEEVQNDICTEEKGPEWKNDPEISPLLATETVGAEGEPGEPAEPEKEQQ